MGPVSRCCLRPGLYTIDVIRRRSCVEVGNQPALNDFDGVLEAQLAFFQALELNLVRVVGCDQVTNDIIEITVFQAQRFQLALQGLDFFFGQLLVDVRGSLCGRPGQAGSAG